MVLVDKCKMLAMSEDVFPSEAQRMISTSRIVSGGESLLLSVRDEYLQAIDADITSKLRSSTLCPSCFVRFSPLKNEHNTFSSLGVLYIVEHPSLMFFLLK